MDSERALVLRAKSGDSDAFCTLYMQYRQKLYRYAYYKLGNAEDAADAVSDSVLSAYEQMPSLKNPDVFSSWLFRMVYCACTAYQKKQIKQRKAVPIEEATLCAEPDDRDTALWVQTALSQLKEQEKDIVLLSAVCGYTSEQISAITGLTPGAVRSKRHRSLEKLRAMMNGA